MGKGEEEREKDKSPRFQGLFEEDVLNSQSKLLFLGGTGENSQKVREHRGGCIIFRQVIFRLAVFCPLYFPSNIADCTGVSQKRDENLQTQSPRRQAIVKPGLSNAHELFYNVCLFYCTCVSYLTCI